jgi:hypothetical protein
MFGSLGTLFAFRLAMARPHLLLLLFSSLILLLLTTVKQPERPAVLAGLAATSALAGLGHTAGWIGIGLAGLWAIGGALGAPVGARSDRGFRWRPAAAVAAGWLLGQLVHPHFPGNFRLHWLQGLVIPFQATGRGSAELEAVIGQELTPLGGAVLLLQASAFVPIGLAIYYLVRRPEARTRGALTLATASIGLLAVSAWRFQRLFELGAPYGVFALALAMGAARVRWSRLQTGAAALVVGAGCVFAQWGLLVETQLVSPPREMAVWIGAHATPGDRVFTAQWADSAPLLYFAPQVQSMVALDPTFFWLKDRDLFGLYVRTAYGRTSDPAQTIPERFGAGWVTLPRQPAYETLARRLAASGPLEARRVYEDPFYQVWEVGPRR